MAGDRVSNNMATLEEGTRMFCHQSILDWGKIFNAVQARTKRGEENIEGQELGVRDKDRQHIFWENATECSSGLRGGTGPFC